MDSLGVRLSGGVSSRHTCVVCARLGMKRCVCLCVHATLTCREGLSPSVFVLSTELSFKQQLPMESYRACMDSTRCLRKEAALDAPFRSEMLDTGSSGPELTACSTLSRHTGSILQCAEPSQRCPASSHSPLPPPKLKPMNFGENPRPKFYQWQQPPLGPTPSAPCPLPRDGHRSRCMAGTSPTHPSTRTQSRARSGTAVASAVEPQE